MKKINFNLDWQFSLNNGNSVNVNLPHDFSIIQERIKDAPSSSSGGFFQGGYGEYRKSFKAKRGKKYFLMCEGVFGLCEVNINGNLVYTNKYGYNCFVADFNDYLRYDKDNQIFIRVNNKALPNSRWYSGSGIYRDVYLLESESCYLDPYGIYAYAEDICSDTAYMCAEVRYVADKAGEAEFDFSVFYSGKANPVYEFKGYAYATQGGNTATFKFQLENPKIWDIDTPYMYEIKATMRINGVKDEDVSAFGIRKVIADYNRGFLLNGRSIKLCGGCIHHDHGPIGARSYKEAEYRRVKKLKEAGFNAIRLSHNPQSPYLYDACDRLGMLVIDELFDYWSDGKQRDDFHPFFEDSYKMWSEQIVLKNRSHPSIVMWSTGNEIPQKSGRGYGYKIARTISEIIHSLDKTRPLTNGICSLWDDKEEYERELATNSLGAPEMDYFAKRLAITSDTIDVLGYNYLEYRTERDLERFKRKLIANTETYPLSAYAVYKQLKDNPRIIGDFVWTAWDYFGETGIGHVDYGEAGPGLCLQDYPLHISGCGDISITGERKPQSYYREISWGLRKDPYIATRHPKESLVPQFPSLWGFYDCAHTWGYAGHDGQECEVFVFAEADEVILYVNDKEVGRQERAENGIYRFFVKYESGSISAVSILNGKVYGKDQIFTEGEAKRLELKAEKIPVKRGICDPVSKIKYIDVKIVDANGSTCTLDNRNVEYFVEGGRILGVGSDYIKSEEMYMATKRQLFNGRGVVIVEKTAKTTVLTAKAENLGEAKIKI